nr:MAG TPA: hypothetical protein [Caudoviricetes sp.]
MIYTPHGLSQCIQKLMIRPSGIGCTLNNQPIGS